MRSQLAVKAEGRSLRLCSPLCPPRVTISKAAFPSCPIQTHRRCSAVLLRAAVPSSANSSELLTADDASRGQPPLGRSFSVPPRPRSAASEDGPPGDARPVGHRSYLDPDLEAAIQEVLSYRSPRAGGLSSPDSGDDGRSVRSVRSAAPLGAADRPGSLRRSASALEVSRPSRRSGRRRSSSSSESSSSSSEEEEERKRKSAKKKSKKSKKKSKKKKKKSSSESGSDSSSDSSSGSTVSYRSTSSVKKGPRAAGGEEPVRPDRARKEEKRRKKQVDSLMMKYLYRPESD